MDKPLRQTVRDSKRHDRRDRKVYAAGELPKDLLEAVRRAEVSAQHADLDKLLVDWQPH